MSTNPAAMTLTRTGASSSARFLAIAGSAADLLDEGIGHTSQMDVDQARKDAISDAMPMSQLVITAKSHRLHINLESVRGADLAGVVFEMVERRLSRQTDSFPLQPP